MTRSAWPASVLLLLGVATAQQDPPTTPEQHEFKKLAEAAEAARNAWAMARKEFTQRAEYQAALEARDAEKLNALLQKAPKLDLTPFADRALELAQRHAGREEAVPPLAWVVRNGGDKERATRALATLHQQHVTSKQLLELFEPSYMLPRAADPGVVRAFLIDVSAKHPDALVRAHALEVRAAMLQGRGASAEDKEVAARLLAEAEILAQGTQLYDRIAAPRFERERLQIGMTAPDIEGEDLDGVKFKLSEYRGKVVVLDFWGDW